MSVASLWEIQVKVRVSKLVADLQEIIGAIRAQAFKLLPIDPAHLHLLGLHSLPTHHKDPFDHLLIAQAITEALTFASANRHAPLYSVQLVPCS